MKHKFIILAVVSIIAITVAGWAIVKHRVSVHLPNDPIANAIIDFQNPVPIQQMNVLTGDEFDLVLQDGRRIHASLSVKTPPSAKPKVLELVNRCRNPRAIFHKDLGGIWLVDIYVTAKNQDGSEVEVSLAKWLQDKNLAYR